MSGRRVEHFYVFLVDDAQGNEGIAALPVPVAKRSEPMIATSQEKLDALWLAARAIVKKSGQRMRVALFTKRVDLKDVPAAEDDE
jgi:hypothetical protein